MSEEFPTFPEFAPQPIKWWQKLLVRCFGERLPGWLEAYQWRGAVWVLKDGFFWGPMVKHTEIKSTNVSEK